MVHHKQTMDILRKKSILKVRISNDFHICSLSLNIFLMSIFCTWTIIFTKIHRTSKVSRANRESLVCTAPQPCAGKNIHSHHLSFEANKKLRPTNRPNLTQVILSFCSIGILQISAESIPVY